VLGAWDCHWRWPTVRAVLLPLRGAVEPGGWEWRLRGAMEPGTGAGRLRARGACAVPPRLLLAGLLGAWEEEDAVGRAGS
jgi:hypothetical protein